MLCSDSTPSIKKNRRYFMKSYVKVTFLFQSLCIYKITDRKNSQRIVNKLGGKVKLCTEQALK